MQETEPGKEAAENELSGVLPVLKPQQSCPISLNMLIIIDYSFKSKPLLICNNQKLIKKWLLTET